MSASRNSLLLFGFILSAATILVAAPAESVEIKIAVAEAKSARILDASVVEVSHSVKARISFYEATKPFVGIDKSLARVLRSKVVEGKYDESDPLGGRPSAWFIISGLSDKGTVMLALGNNDTIFYRGCSAFTTTAYQNDDRAFGDGNTRDANLWKMLWEFASAANATEKK